MSENSCDMLSLKWNNHSVSFLHTLNHVRTKESLCDVTIACEGNMYPLHKLVLSNCSEYFQQIFESISSKDPVIVLAGVDKASFEVLLNYMYIGEVNVEQQKLACLIKAAECLKIKGLAVPDTDYDNEEKLTQKRSLNNSHYSRIRKKHKLNSVTEEEKNVIDEGNRDKNEENLDDANEYNSSDQRELNISKEVIDCELNDLVTERVIKSEHLENDVKEENSNSDIFGDDPMAQMENEEEQTNQYDEIPTADYNNSSAPPWELNDLLNSNSFIQNNENCSSKMGIINEAMELGSVHQSYKILPSAKRSVGQKYMHLNTKVHQCPHCDYSTIYKSHMTSHIRKHTGEKPFTCPVCDYRCAQRSNLTVHMNIHKQKESDLFLGNNFSSV